MDSLPRVDSELYSGLGFIVYRHMVVEFSHPLGVFCVRLVVPPGSSFAASFLVRVLPCFLVSIRPLCPNSGGALLSLLH